jgi:hypothetical protein
MRQALPPADDPTATGRTLSRAGAKRAVAGRGRCTDDFSLPRMLHAAFLRSPFAHTKILAMDTSEAKRQPGVALIMTGAELAKLVTGPWVGTLTCFPGMKSAPQYPMAVDRACWVGEPVAMVVARTRAEAEDAAELIVVEWEELPAVTDRRTALDPETPVLHPELGDNLAFRKTNRSHRRGLRQGRPVIGDLRFRPTGVALSRAARPPMTKARAADHHRSSQCPHVSTYCAYRRPQQRRELSTRRRRLSASRSHSDELATTRRHQLGRPSSSPPTAGSFITARPGEHREWRIAVSKSGRSGL